MAERICSTCKVVKDEYHFITNCKLYTNEGLMLYSAIITICPNFNNRSEEEKCLFLFTVERDIIIETVKFVQAPSKHLLLARFWQALARFWRFWQTQILAPQQLCHMFAGICFKEYSLSELHHTWATSM